MSFHHVACAQPRLALHLSAQTGVPDAYESTDTPNTPRACMLWVLNREVVLGTHPQHAHAQHASTCPELVTRVTKRCLCRCLTTPSPVRPGLPASHAVLGTGAAGRGSSTPLNPSASGPQTAPALHHPQLLQPEPCSNSTHRLHTCMLASTIALQPWHQHATDCQLKQPTAITSAQNLHTSSANSNQTVSHILHVLLSSV